MRLGKRRWKLDDTACERLAQLLLVLFGAAILSYSFLGPISRCEMETNEFPIIALQYRGSIFLSEADAAHIARDLPGVYAHAQAVHGSNIFASLPQISDGAWYYYYFPIYPLLCLPLKLLFQLLAVDQERCFTVTNAALVLVSLWFVQKKLKVPAKQRLLAVALLMASPAIFNVNYIYYMCFMSAFVTMALVQWYNGRYKSGALLLSIAGMSNPTIMAAGIVMIAEYLTRTVRAYLGGPRTWRAARGYIWQTVCYGVCYVPCLAQFIINWALHIPNYSPLGTYGDTKQWFARFMMYLFDPSLGLGSFSPLAAVLFLALVLAGVFRKKYRTLLWGGVLFGTVAAFSLMLHINCGMLYCARYIIFTWPIVPLFFATDGYELLRPAWSRKILYPAMFLLAVFLLFVNKGVSAYDFNRETQWILNNVPQLYDPYYATFYCRTLHMDGAYNITDPAYYLDPRTDEVRKLIYKADEGQAQKVLSDLAGSEASTAYLEQKLEKYGLDGQYHYVDFPRAGQYQVHEKTPEEKGELRSKSIVAESQDLEVGSAAYGQLACLPFTIKKDTVYKVEITLGENTDFAQAERAVPVVDFYAPTGYDNGEQEAGGFTRYGRYKYTYYFDSGDVGGETLDGWVRMFTANVPDAPIPVDILRVTEMERVG